ncbi:hypothetical protein [Streptomyces sp. NPDC002851]
MPVDKDSNSSKDEADSAEKSPFGILFNGGEAGAGSAEKAAEDLEGDTPGAGKGAWDDEEESVSGSVSGYVHDLESGRDPWHPRQTAHGALDVMRGFLSPHFNKFQTAAGEQREASENPKSTSSMASSTLKSSAEEDTFRNAVKISDEDQPSISEEAKRRLKEAHYQTEGAVLIVGKFGESAYDVALVPSDHSQAYVVTSSSLYKVDLTAGTKRKLVTSEPLGSPRGVAVDGNNNAYVTDYSGGRVLRVNLSTGETETIVTGVKAFGIALDETGKKAHVTDYDAGKLFAVDLERKDQKELIADGLGQSTTGVALDGKGKAYTGHWNRGDLWEVNLPPDAPGKRQVAEDSGAYFGIALDGRTAYAGEHLDDCLYKVDLGTGKRSIAVRKTGGNFSPLGLALDSDNAVLYVTTYEGGQLWRFSLGVLRSPELIEITPGV